MNSIESLQWRYAVKEFDQNKLLTKEQLNTLKQAFNLTPTSYGLQPIKLVVVQNKQIQKQLMEYSWNQPKVAQASHVLVICVVDKLTEKDVERYIQLIKNIRDTSDEILNPFEGQLKEYISKKTEKEIFEWSKNQAYISLGNLMAVAANEKIDGCPMEGFIAEKYDEILNLKSHNLKSVLAFPVGFRSENDPMKNQKKVRKKLEESILEIL